MKNERIINDCDNCHYYEYFRCYGFDCTHKDAPSEDERFDEPLAENREGGFPKWCPMIGKVEGFEWKMKGG